MEKSDALYIEHMLAMSQKAIGFASMRGRSQYDSDETLRLAMTRLVEIILQVDEEVVWKTIHEELPKLVPLLESLIAKLRRAGA